ncbi:hypothetical protein F183_A03830 [Bryobacterales bacterium F-183]|nr:hypothetical protein F183_A03830 [Bryobacterales bacterium F-183]
MTVTWTLPEHLRQLFSMEPSSSASTPALPHPGAAAPLPLQWFAAVALAAVICYRTAMETAALSYSDSRYNYVLVGIAVVLVLIYQERDFLIGPTLRNDIRGAVLAGAGIVANLALTYGADVELYWRYLGLAAAWIGALWYLHGVESLREGMFQVIMLVASAPLPEAWIHGFEVFLQHASAEVSDVIFQMLGTPVYREGLVFALPGLNIEVARECSGMRSTTALIMVVAVCAHLLLRRTGSKALMLFLTIPVGIIKNAVRIVILAWLGSNVSAGYLDGPLHKQGGPLFTLTAVALLGPTLWLLMRSEKRQQQQQR